MTKAQGAIQSNCDSTYCPLQGQGATEYLVLLAVVLIVALVSVALLGFFPGMASDAQATQSKAYWSSASPIAITEWDAKGWDAAATAPYLRVRNTGSYPIRITKLLGPSGQSISQITLDSSNAVNMSPYYYLSPGEESYFAWKGIYTTVPAHREIHFVTTGSWGVYLGGASSICNYPATDSRGTLVMKDFGFEYIEYIEGQQITKRQVGKPLVIKCS